MFNKACLNHLGHLMIVRKIIDINKKGRGNTAYCKTVASSSSLIKIGPCKVMIPDVSIPECASRIPDHSPCMVLDFIIKWIQNCKYMSLQVISSGSPLRFFLKRALMIKKHLKSSYTIYKQLVQNSVYTYT